MDLVFTWPKLALTGLQVYDGYERVQKWRLGTRDAADDKKNKDDGSSDTSALSSSATAEVAATPIRNAVSTWQLFGCFLLTGHREG
jgi:hypothetical protein